MLKKFFIIFFIFGFICFSWALIEPFQLKVESNEIIDSDVPEFIKYKKIIFAADFHFGHYFSTERLEKVVRLINEQNPDLVLLGGDYINKEPNLADDTFRIFGKIKAKYGVYGVLGNHDSVLRDNRKIRILEAANKANIKILLNEAVWISEGNERFKIGGVGDFWHDTQNLEPTIGDAKTDDFVILLSHNPDFSEFLETDKIDLVLSGHTHGGQVTFFGLYAPNTQSSFGQKYREGLVKNQYSQVFVTHGVGTTLLPIRFFAKPEINVVVLK